MLKNYFTIGWRNLVRTRVCSVINIVGLAIGMAVAMTIGLWIFDEISYNWSFKNHDRFAQLYHHVTFGNEIMTISDVPAPMGEALKNNVVGFEDVSVTSWPREHVISYGETKMSQTGMFAEPQFLRMLPVELLNGSNFGDADVHSILVSNTLARTLLGDNPIGKTIKLDNRDLLSVAGVFEDFPSNSHFAEVKVLLPMAYYFNVNESNRKSQNNWEDYSFQCFVLLEDKAVREEIEAKIRHVLYEKSSSDGKAINPEGILFPMDKWHLYSEFKGGINTGGQIRFIWMFGIIGIFVLLLACVNFMNLSTAGSERRSREVGIRKVMGSGRNQLVFQFLSESLLMVCVGYLLGLTITVFLLPWFNELADKKMTIPWTDSYFILGSLTFIIVTSLLAGSYPALYLSGFNPVKVLKGTHKASRVAALPRRVMVVMQFTTSIVLIIGTMVIFLQIQHAKNRPVGFDREGIFHMAIRTEALAKADYNSLRSELLSTGAIENMALSDHPVTGSMSADASLSWEGKDPALRPLIGMNSCSHDFPKTNGFEFVDGRDFSRDYRTDSTAVIINEMAAKLISEENVIGKKIVFGHGREREIIGIIKDQVRWTPFVKQSPHLYYINYSERGYLTIRLNRRLGTHEAIRKIEAVIRKFDPEAPFDYTFQDEDYARQFKMEERIGTFASVFSTLAIFISCIGIFGLATFTASQRTREIGIRKVLGASVFNLWKMLSNDFMKLILIAILLGTPLAYYLSIQWLQQYDYRVEISWTIFAIADIMAVVITLLTISYQSLKAALMNPVTSLRTE